MNSRLLVDLSAFNEVIEKPVNLFITKKIPGEQKELSPVEKINDKKIWIIAEQIGLDLQTKNMCCHL